VIIGLTLAKEQKVVTLSQEWKYHSQAYGFLSKLRICILPLNFTWRAISSVGRGQVAARFRINGSPGHFGQDAEFRNGAALHLDLQAIRFRPDIPAVGDQESCQHYRRGVLAVFRDLQVGAADSNSSSHQ
jgi:hypothetical protein